jgi:hypothetical protein
VIVTPFSLRQLMYEANADEAFDVLPESEPPPQAVVNSTATEAAARVAARRCAFELTTGTMSLLLPRAGRRKKSGRTCAECRTALGVA